MTPHRVTGLLHWSVGTLICLVLIAAPVQAQNLERQKQEERQNYFDKWLNETVAYIISPEERSVFEELSTDEERERFVEQFWYRRDPDQRTPTNEFKEEHYRRIAYANEHFSAGWRGWETDRGRVYIIHGPPDEIEENVSGGEYQRTLPEGGGSTSTYPFQKWRYRYIEGMGNNVEIEFVDRDFSGVYRLALSPSEKDAFLNVPNAGFTAAEELGFATRIQRPYFTPSGSYPLMNYREQDSAFARYERFVNIQRPVDIKYHDLKQLVKTDIRFGDLPFKTRVDLFQLNEERCLVPITLEIANRNLAFSQAAGVESARAAIYGMITDLGNHLVAEFEDEVIASFAPGQLESGLRQSSAYNRVLLLDAGKRYKLQVIVKDLNSEVVGSAVRPIVTSKIASNELSASPLVVSSYIAPAQESTGGEQQFVLGNVVVKPSLGRQFSPNDYFAVYLQLYNVAIDQSSQQPSFLVRYRVRNGDETVLEFQDESGESVQYFSPRRMVLIKRIPLQSLAAGTYQIEVAFTDRIRSKEVTSSETFRIGSDQ